MSAYCFVQIIVGKIMKSNLRAEDLCDETGYMQEGG